MYSKFMSTPSSESPNSSEAEYLKAVHLIETGETFFAESVEIYCDSQEGLAASLGDILQSGRLYDDDELRLAGDVDDVVNAFSECIGSINDNYRCKGDEDDGLIHPKDDVTDDIATRVRTLLQLTTEAIDRLSDVTAWIPGLKAKTHTANIRRDIQLQIASICMDSNSEHDVGVQEIETRQQLADLLRNQLMTETERILEIFRESLETNPTVGAGEPEADTEFINCARWIESRRPNSLGRLCLYTAHTLE